MACAHIVAICFALPAAEPCLDNGPVCSLSLEQRGSDPGPAACQAGEGPSFAPRVQGWELAS